MVAWRLNLRRRFSSGKPDDLDGHLGRFEDSRRAIFEDAYTLVKHEMESGKEKRLVGMSGPESVTCLNVNRKFGAREPNTSVGTGLDSSNNSESSGFC